MNHLHCMMKEKESYHLFHKLRETLFVILAVITSSLAVSQLKNYRVLGLVILTIWNVGVLQ